MLNVDTITRSNIARGDIPVIPSKNTQNSSDHKLYESTGKEAANNLGIAKGTLYRWHMKYTSDGNKTRNVTLEEEKKAMQLKNAELWMKRDIKKQRPISQNLKQSISIC